MFFFGLTVAAVFYFYDVFGLQIPWFAYMCIAIFASSIGISLFYLLLKQYEKYKEQNKFNIIGIPLDLRKLHQDNCEQQSGNAQLRAKKGHNSRIFYINMIGKSEADSKEQKIQSNGDRPKEAEVEASYNKDHATAAKIIRIRNTERQTSLNKLQPSAEFSHTKRLAMRWLETDLNEDEQSQQREKNTIMTLKQ